MLERYFLKPQTIDGIRNSWLADPIEKYVTWLTEKGYAARNVIARVPILKRFARFSWLQGARSFDDLPDLVEPFVADWVASRDNGRSPERTHRFRNEIRGPVEQMLSLVVSHFVGRGRTPRALVDPFATQVPGFFSYLREERGLRETTIKTYQHWLRPFESYLRQVGVETLSELSPAIVSAFITSSIDGFSRNTITGFCCCQRVFLRYLHREAIIDRDLAAVVEPPQQRRLSNLPRSITWDEVKRMLEAVDRRAAVGKRDYAILLLLVTYGLRAREVAALTLDDIDWERERLLVPERKAGHCTAYPLSAVVGEALLEYLKNARPETAERSVFFRMHAPRTPLTYTAVGSRASYYLHKANIQVRRPGSHTLRHTCVQRLIEAEFPLDTIGQYVGHSSPQSTEIYSKVAVETLREVALGDGEALV